MWGKLLRHIILANRNRNIYIAPLQINQRAYADPDVFGMPGVFGSHN